jgi:tetratricopeptide (TPR) repeat protein
VRGNGDVAKVVVILSAGGHDDVKLRDGLAKHLAPWARAAAAEVWHEGRLQGGERLALLDERVLRARAVVVLVTADLLADDARMTLVEGARSRGAHVVPVIARACDWKATWFGDLAVLPANHTTVAMCSDPGEVWNQVAPTLGDIWRNAVILPVDGAASVPARRPPSNLPAQRLFVGRRRDLAAVLVRLTSSGTAAITQRATVFGLGGVGKTSLALAYAHAHAADYPGGLYWVRAEGEPVRALLAFSGELRAIAPPAVAAVLARLPPDDAEAIAAGVRLALQSNSEPSLLVLDNVDADWSTHVPGGAVHVLVTTREPDLALGGDRARLRLDVLERADALALADEITGDCAAIDTAARDRVVMDALGGLAVAVEMAARAVLRWTKTWARYEIGLRSQAEALLGDPRLFGDGYRRGAFAAIDLSLARCTDSTARALLGSLATLAPEGAPVDWIEAGAGAETDALATMSAWEALAEAGFVRLDGAERRAALHRLVHRRLAATMGPEARGARAAAMAPVVEAWLLATVDQGRLPEVEARVPHVEAVLGALNALGGVRAWIGIANQLAEHLWHRGAYLVARDLFQRALDAAEQLDPPDEGRVAVQLNNLAGVHRDLGDAASARPLLERALHIHESALGSDHSSVASHLSSLALVHRDLGDAAGARLLLERALRIDEKALGSDHPSVAVHLSVLATVLRDLGDAAGARPLLERAIRIGEKALGSVHPSVAVRLSSLALVHRDLGDAAGARLLLERALRIDEKALGSDHPNVAAHLSNLATVLQAIGDATGARLLLERALRIGEKALGSDHPSFAVGLFRLAVVLQDLGDAAGARPLLERAIAIADKRLGPEHPHTRLFRQNLASLGPADHTR